MICCELELIKVSFGNLIRQVVFQHHIFNQRLHIRSHAIQGRMSKLRVNSLVRLDSIRSQVISYYSTEAAR